MSDDPILEEIRSYRDALAQKYHGDPDGFYQWLKACEERSRKQGRSFVSRAPKRLQPTSTPFDD